MRPRRIIAVTPDEAFGKQLATALTAAGGDVEMHRTLDSLGDRELHAAMCVLHVGDQLGAVAASVLPRLSVDCRVIVVLPRGSLATLVDLMQASPQVAGMMVAEDFDARRLYGIAARMLSGDIFGLEKVMKSGTLIQSQLVHDNEGRGPCIATVSAFAERMGVPRGTLAPIEQSLDEMLMNALYSAPVDAGGRPVFSGVSAKSRATLRIEQTVEVQYAFDGRQLAIAVRDAFGSLERSTVLRVLHKCLHAEDKIDRKAAGAGVGLYLMVNASTTVSFHIVPGIATEVVCTFDLQTPKLRLEQLGVFVEPTDVSGKLVSARRPNRAMRLRRSLGPTERRVAAIALAAFVLAAVSVVIVARVFGTAKPATLELDSQPTGARVVIDGKLAGETPLRLTTLPPDERVTVAFERVGYRPATVLVGVPSSGERASHVQTLAPSEDHVRVRFVTRPPGARVIELGAKGDPVARPGDRTYTPAEVFVEIGKPQRFVLAMPSHIPIVVEPFTPARGGDVIEKGGDLVEGPTLRIESTTAGTATVVGTPHCRHVALPAECTVAPGSYVVDFVGTDKVKATRTVQLADGDTTVTFGLGKPRSK